MGRRKKMSPKTKPEGVLESMEIFQRLRYGGEHFPVQQKLVCKHILSNYQQVAFMTIEELGSSCGVSPATVVRTVSRLKYGSYHEMLRVIQEMLISTKTSLWWQIEKSWENREKPDLETEKLVLSEVARENVESIKRSLSSLLLDNFTQACDSLKKARKIAILGLRSTKGAALICYSLFHQFLDNVILPDHAGSDEMYADLVDLNPDDVLLAISVGGPHFAARTIDAVKYVHDRGIQVVLITTDMSCPAAPFADVILHVSTTEGHYSLVPVITIIDALVVEMGHHYRDKAIDKLRNLEKLLAKMKITT
jgi:DNA-binding MurR/RpiR family transcriptional regulator